ncbi:MAG: peptidylprolyl isomerase [Candidatus Sumerlaeia bacterium]|nr:peptidylprolyl isomerase [Candidatus Sumerlaeia bacterium]
MIRRTAAALLATALALPALAQESAPLVRKSDKPRQTIVVGKRAAEAQRAPQGERAEQRNPAEVVGVVNSHRLSRGQLDFFIEKRVRELGDAALLGDNEGRVIIIDPARRAPASAADAEVAENQARLREQTRRRLEGEALKGWLEQRVLAEEARRHNLTVEADEFARRIARIEAEDGLTDAELAANLDLAGITREQFEAEVYDALLVEAFLAKYVEANWTDKDLMKFFQRAPEEFGRPAEMRIARFFIPVEPGTPSAQAKALRDKAEAVAKQLRRDKDHESVIGDSIDSIAGFYGDPDSGWISTGYLELPEDVQKAAARLEPGEVSKVVSDHEYDTGAPVLRSFQVVKMIERREAQKPTFETAKPILVSRLQYEARREILPRLLRSGSHKVVSNLGGIAPEALPSDEEILKLMATSKPMDLKRPATVAN